MPLVTWSICRELAKGKEDNAVRNAYDIFDGRISASAEDDNTDNERDDGPDTNQDVLSRIPLALAQESEPHQARD